MGTRLGLGPKCLLRLGDRSLLEILVETLQPLVDEILVATPAQFEPQVVKILRGRARTVPGGASRQQSIDNLLQASSGNILLIQDAARPFASAALCAAVLDAARLHGAAGAFLDPTVPVGRVAQGRVASYQTRQEARIFQAPQAFTRQTLLDAGEKTRGREFQSTAQMVIDAGYPLTAIEGEPENIKITTSLDWQIAQRVIAPKLGLET